MPIGWYLYTAIIGLLLSVIPGLTLNQFPDQGILQ